MTTHPSGAQFEITHADLRATIVEVGGGLRTLRAGDLAVLDGYPVEEMCHDGRGQLLMPWPNRLAGGRYTFQGQPNQLSLSEPSHGNAIHGLVRWANWSVVAHQAAEVTLALQLHPQPGYPHLLNLSARYTLSEEGLAVRLRAINHGTKGCPFGAGQHPYVCAGTPLVNTALLQVPARTIYQYDQNLIPTEAVSVEGTPLDFRELRPIGDTEINMDYTDLERDASGRASVLLQAPDGGARVELWMDEAFKHVTVYTGETVQPPERRRQSVAIEPMTCPPNAFVSGQDLVVLRPGERWEGSWGLRVCQ